jgi:hypothetical protein
MKNFRFYLFLLCFAFSGLASYSQLDVKAEFVKKIDKQISRIDSMARISRYRNSISNRKVFISGWVVENGLYFKQRVKNFSGGLRKEKIKIYDYSYNNKKLILYAVKINGKYHYVKYYETGRDKDYGIIKLSKEIFIDSRLYKKTVYKLK